MSESHDPTYDNPPVVETILGVQFEPLPRWRNAHLGAFWATLPVEWQSEELKVSDAPALEPQYERFGERQFWAKLVQFRIAQAPQARAQFALKDRMIQLQNGRLIFNWIEQDKQRYPRYPALRDEFLETWNRFLNFAESRCPDAIVPNQWEVTYINRIPKGSVWQDTSDWSFTRLLGSLDGPTPTTRLESFLGEWHYEIVPEKGRLHVEWKHGQRDDDSREEVVFLTLTARGPIPESESPIDAISAGLNMGHDTIVSSFPKIVSDAANKVWGLHDADSRSQLQPLE